MRQIVCLPQRRAQPLRQRTICCQDVEDMSEQNDFMRRTLDAIGPPIFGVEEWNGRRWVTGSGGTPPSSDTSVAPGSVTRVTLRFEADQDSFVEVETGIGNQIGSWVHSGSDRHLLLRWLLVRFPPFAPDDSIMYPLSVGPMKPDIEVVGTHAQLKVISDGVVWAAGGPVADRWVCAVGRGLNPADIRLTAANPDDYV